MPLFSATAAAALAGRTVRCAVLVLFDFTSAPMRVWMGTGPLVAGGQTWSGVGELGAIDGLEAAIGDVAPQTTFSMSGVAPGIVTETLAGASEVKDREVVVSIQMLDEDLQPLDAPVAIYVGLMDVIKVQATGPSSRTVQVTAETLFTRRAMPAWGYLSDRDQNALFPGDRGLEMVPSMVAKSVIWPPAFG